MKKITMLLSFLLFSSWAFSQSCEQVFSAEGFDTNTVLNIQSTSLNCYAGTVNSITISDVNLGFFCGSWYSYSIDIDGVVTNDVCSEDLEGMVITNFSQITITSEDIDEEQDNLSIDVTIAVNFTSTTIPNCDAELISPVSGSTENNLLGKLTWTAATGGVVGYFLSVGTTTGGTDVLNMQDVGDVTTFDIAGLLLENQEYYVNITPYNTIGNATACTEYNFITTSYGPGNLCQNAIEIGTLPYTTTDDTANYADIYYEGTPGASGCGSTYSYLNGNDVIYAFTATFDGSISITMTPEEDNTYSGIFIYDSCANIGVECSGGVANSGFASREIPEFSVQNGQTYYFVISTWAAPQSVSYELEITENSCTNATATYAVVSDCANGEQFMINVNVSDLGTATSVSVFDDLGGIAQTLSAPGTLSFGPYDNGTDVIMTVANDQDSTCEAYSTTLTQTDCPPANDECANAEVLTVNADYACASTTTGTIAGATASTVTGNTCSGTADDDVWYAFTATSTVHKIAITNVAGSVTDMYHSVWTGTCDALTLVPSSCSDNNTSSPQNLVIGQTYYVRVYTYTATAGQDTTFTICIGTPPAPPANDECANAEVLTVSPTLDCTTSTSGTIAGATASTVTGNTCLGSADDDVWYAFTATNTKQQIAISNVSGSVTDMYHSLWTGTCDALTMVPDSCSDSNTSTPENLVVGQTYYVRVYTYTTAAGQDTVFDICIGTPPPAPANDDCAAAIAITVDEQFCNGTNNNGDNTSATDSGVDNPDCFGAGSNDVWFSFVAPENTASVNISTEFLGGTLIDTQIALYSGTCGTLVEEDCAQDGTLVLSNGFAWNSTITDAPVTAGETYYVRVSGYTNARIGSFCLDIATNQSLANTDFDKNNFTVYPNPVKDILNVSYTQNISNVAVYNMLGQEVVSKTMDANQGQIDLSALASGTYLVKVKTETAVQTIKIVKQ